MARCCGTSSVRLANNELPVESATAGVCAPFEDEMRRTRSFAPLTSCKLALARKGKQQAVGRARWSPAAAAAAAAADWHLGVLPVGDARWDLPVLLVFDRGAAGRGVHDRHRHVPGRPGHLFVPELWRVHRIDWHVLQQPGCRQIVAIISPACTSVKLTVATGQRALSIARQQPA